MDKKIYFQIILLSLIAITIAQTTLAATIWVNPDNTGAKDGISKQTGYNTLWDAFDVMSSGDTVIIANGDWRNITGMYIDANHMPPDGTNNSYSKVIAETDFEVKLPYIRIETMPSNMHGYLEFQGIVFDNRYIGSGYGHLVYHMHHTKFIRCGFFAYGLTGNRHACGFGNADSNRSKNQYNLMEDCVVWGSGRYMVYSKYGQYNVFRRVVVRHDLHQPYGPGDKDAGQIFNFRAYACDSHFYQNCISLDSDRVEYYNNGTLNGEAGGYWIGDQYGGTGSKISGSVSIKDLYLAYYLGGQISTARAKIGTREDHPNNINYMVANRTITISALEAGPQYDYTVSIRVIKANGSNMPMELYNISQNITVVLGTDENGSLNPLKNKASLVVQKLNNLSFITAYLNNGGELPLNYTEGPHYIFGGKNDTIYLDNSIALDNVEHNTSSTLNAFVLPSSINMFASNFLGKGAIGPNQDGIYGKNSGKKYIVNSIIKDVGEFGVFGVSNKYINYYNVTSGSYGEGSQSYDPEENGLLYPLRIENNSRLSHDGYNLSQVGPTILKKIGVSGTLYGEVGWNETTDEDLWPWKYEDKIKELMSDSIIVNETNLGGYGFTEKGKLSINGFNQTLTSYIWEYLGNPCPEEICNYTVPHTYHKADLDYSGVIEDPEAKSFWQRWMSNLESFSDMFDVLRVWKSG